MGLRDRRIVLGGIGVFLGGLVSGCPEFYNWAQEHGPIGTGGDPGTSVEPSGDYAHKVAISRPNGSNDPITNMLGPPDSLSVRLNQKANFVVHFGRNFDRIYFGGSFSNLMNLSIWSADQVYRAKGIREEFQEFGSLDQSGREKLVLDSNYMALELKAGGNLTPGVSGFNVSGIREGEIGFFLGGLMPTKMAYVSFTDDVAGQRSGAVWTLNYVRVA